MLNSTIPRTSNCYMQSSGGSQQVFKLCLTGSQGRLTNVDVRCQRHVNDLLMSMPGVQIRRRKCNGDENELLCELRPTIESYCTVARHIQLMHGLHDNDVRFFLAADEPETYTQVAIAPTAVL